MDAADALYSLSTQPHDTLDWPTCWLRYSVLVERADGTSSLLWTDRNYSPYSICNMTDGPLPGPGAPTVLDPATLVLQDDFANSSPVPGAAKGHPDALQAFSFTILMFTGRATIQVSLVTQPSKDSSYWFDVSFQDFVAASDTVAVNVVGDFLWLRAKPPAPAPVVVPAAPVLPEPATTPLPILPGRPAIWRSASCAR